MIIEIDEDEAALLVLALVTQIKSGDGGFEPDMAKLLAKLLLHDEVRSTLLLYSMDGRDS